MKIPLICASCHTVFYVFSSAVKQQSKRKYCSLKCYIATKKPKQSRQCLQCGTNFFVYTSAIKNSGAKYCSPACYQSTKIPKQLRICVGCSQSFFVHMSATVKGGGKYCSPKCYHAVQRTDPETRARAGSDIPDNPNGCWLWKGTINEKRGGYGSFYDGTRVQTTIHRWSYRHFIGPIPKGMYVCHHCDTPACWNPRHLFLGTNIDNLRDMRNKGRHIKGQHCWNAKLTEEAVIIIRASTESTAILSARYGVGISRICAIRKGKGWKHITLPKSDSI